MTRENIRATVSDEIERRILTECKAEGIRKGEFVERAVKAYLKRLPGLVQSTAEPKIVERPKRYDTEELERFAIAMRDKHVFELNSLLGKIRVMGK